MREDPLQSEKEEYSLFHYGEALDDARNCLEQQGIRGAFTVIVDLGLSRRDACFRFPAHPNDEMSAMMSRGVDSPPPPGSRADDETDGVLISVVVFTTEMSCVARASRYSIEIIAGQTTTCCEL